MPLSPAPLLPGTSPIPTPGRRPPDRRALRLGALAALPVLVLALVVGKFALPYALFLAPGLQAQAGGGDSGSGVGDFQGFQFVWTRHQTGGGYTTPASLDNLRPEQERYLLAFDRPAGCRYLARWRLCQGHSGCAPGRPDADP